MTNTILLNGQEVQSIFTSITKNDTNAHLLLQIIDEELSDISPLIKTTFPEQGGLSVYLHAVYEGAEMSQAILLKKSFGDHARSVIPDKISHRLISADTKRIVSVDGGNDVCWAVLSNKPEAFSTLAKTYKQFGIALPLNEKEATFSSTENVRNNLARKLTPLDLAVQLYVAQRMQDQEADRTQALAATLEKKIGSLTELLLPQAYLTDTDPNITTASEKTATKIQQLIELGAKGSREAYFPVDRESLADPFNNSSGFEMTSLSEFCTANNSLFPAALLKTLKECPALPPPSPGR